MLDTKAVPVIVEEFGQLKSEQACQRAFSHSAGEGVTPSRFDRAGYQSALPLAGLPAPTKDNQGLAELYGVYARVVSGQEVLESSGIASLAEGVDLEGLHLYATRYLPHELVCWGGDLAELFPAIWKSLEKRGVITTDFMRFWFRQSRPVADPYDFFYLKLERWVEFVGEAAPDLLEQAQREAGILRALHAELNDEPVVLEGRA